jgi:hypothetical protein
MKKHLRWTPLILLVLASCGTTNGSSLGSSSSTSGSNSNASSVSIAPIDDAAFAYALSINRLEEVDFDINLDALVQSSNPQSQRLAVNGPRKNQTLSPGSVDIDTTEDTLTYSLIPDSSNVGLEFRNLNQGISANGLRSKDQVDTALSTISLVDTWVVYEQDKYLLQYDETTDVVSLYIANVGFSSPSDNTYSLKKITVQYTEFGDLLVEVYDAYRDESFTTFSHLRFIKDSLYEMSSDYWPGGVEEAIPTMGGPGWFKAVKDPNTGLWKYWRSGYYNAGFNVQTPNGWIQTYVRVAPEDQNPEDVASFNQMKVSSNAQENDVFYFDLNDFNQTQLTFYPSALDGWSSIKAPYSTSVLKNLKDWTPDNPDVALYETSEGRLIVDNGFEGAPIPTTVFASNVDDINGLGYVAYVAMSQVTISKNYRDMLDELLVLFNSNGLTYKHGDLNQLFKEVMDVTNNLNRLFNQFELNGVSGFSNLKVLRDVVAAEMDIIQSLPSTFVPLLTAFPSLNASELPPVVINGSAILSLASSTTGSVTFNSDTQTISTSTLSVSIPQTVLLTQGAAYTLKYGWFADGFVIPVGEETPVIYQGGTLTITGNLTLDVIPTVANTYRLVISLEKVNEESTLRISSYTAVPVASFEEISVELEAINGLVPNVTYQSNEGLTLTLRYQDIGAPSVKYLPLAQTFNGEDVGNVLSLTLMEGLTIEALLSDFEIFDNVDQQLIFNVSQLTLNDSAVESTLDLIQVGTYTYTLEDSAGNVTILTVIFTEPPVL